MEQQKFRQAENIALRKMAGEHYLIVLDIGESKMFDLNETGLWFWKQMESPKTKAQLLAAMLNDYDVDRQTAADEIDRFLNHLTERNLINVLP